ncbi:MAG: MarR family winged helix-turn-helix transcriptional regulator, partial [Thermocrispum sp.]
KQHNTVFTALECALQEHGIGVSEFEALAFLHTYENKCRSADLGEAAQLTQSASSRLVARMEKAGLVRRELCEMDRRGVYVSLTDAGRERYEQAKPSHRAVLAATLGTV